jgi:hypothetical protein
MGAIAFLLPRGGLPKGTETKEKNHMAAIGDNSKELTPAEDKALYMHHFRAVLAQTEICNRENEERKRLRKLAKADGIVLSDIDFGLRCATIDDPQIIADQLVRHSEIAQFFALPVGTQVELNLDREPAVDRAKREGTAAGFAAKDRASPYGIDSKQGQAWLGAYDAAQKKAADDLAAAMLKKQAARADDGDNDPDDDETEEAA